MHKFFHDYVSVIVSPPNHSFLSQNKTKSGIFAPTLLKKNVKNPVIKYVLLLPEINDKPELDISNVHRLGTGVRKLTQGINLRPIIGIV